MNSEVALSAARRLGVDVANLTYRLALAEATLDEIRGLVFAADPNGGMFPRIDTNMWRRRAGLGPSSSEIVLTEEQSAVACEIINALAQLL